MSENDIVVPSDPVRTVIYDAVMHALKIGAPGLAEAGRTPIALNAAAKASHELKRQGYVFGTEAEKLREDLAVARAMNRFHIKLAAVNGEKTTLADVKLETTAAERAHHYQELTAAGEGLHLRERFLYYLLRDFERIVSAIDGSPPSEIGRRS